MICVDCEVNEATTEERLPVETAEGMTTEVRPLCEECYNKLQGIQ